MESLFFKVLNMSITGSLLILAVICLRVILKKSPKWINVMLWGIAAIRLLCPIQIESPFSLIKVANPVPQEITMAKNPQIQSGVSTINQMVNPVLSKSFSPSPYASVNPLQLLAFAATIVWAVGIVILAFYALFSYLRIYFKVKASVVLEPGVKMCDGIATPFILGVIRPQIYVSSDLSAEEKEHVLAHEKAHLKRKDHVWKPLGFLVLMLHWFNPLVWIAYILLCKDIELACDEKVICDMNKEESVLYSQSLLNLSVSRQRILACPLAFGEVSVKARIKYVLSYKKPGFWGMVASVLICVFVAVGFLTNQSKAALANAAVDNATPENSKYWPLILDQNQAYFVVEDEGVRQIHVTTANSSGGLVNADNSDFKPGEKVYLDIDYDSDSDMYLVITTMDKDENPIKSWNYGTEVKEKIGKNKEEDAARKTIVEDAILSEISNKMEGRYNAADYYELATEVEGNNITTYGVAMYMDADVVNGKVVEKSASHVPVMVKMKYKEDGDMEIDYWEAEDGGRYEKSIRENFPEGIADEAINCQQFTKEQEEKCYEKILESSENK